MSANTSLEPAALHRIAVVGASGRMGRMLVDTITAAPDCQLTGALDTPDSLFLGADAAAFAGKRSGVNIVSELAQGLTNAAYLIDFTRPEGTMQHLRHCQAQGIKMVIGTTGFTPEQKAEIQAASKDIAIVMAPNMAVGVNVVLKLLRHAAAALNQGYDIEIIEAHHCHKVDAPSGTALRSGGRCFGS
jgi:4-hydroxy-tetrahydrodipicolinate reductase